MSLEPAKVPTVYTVGSPRRGASILKVFPKWAEALGLQADIKAINLLPHAPPDEYRKTAQFLKGDPLSLGAFVTTHEWEMFKACRDIFDCVDPFGEKLKEVSCISKKDGKFSAHAKDPIASGLALEAFVPSNFWKENGGEVLLLGASGSSLAIAQYFALKGFGGNVPKRITIANRSEQSLFSAQEALQELCDRVEFRFILIPTLDGADRLIATLPPYSLIINATEADKGVPRSPTTSAVSYPRNCLIWEIDYWGDLLFMKQAQQQKKMLYIKDGWMYFIYNWGRFIEQVFHIEIDLLTLDKLSSIARVIKRKQIVMNNIEWAEGVAVDFDFRIGLS